jgi:hypothetical protein
MLKGIVQPKKRGVKRGTFRTVLTFYTIADIFFEHLKVVGNEKVGGSGMCQTVLIWLRPRRSRFVSLSILPSSLILSISVSAPVKQNE